MTTEQDAKKEIRLMFLEAKRRISVWDISECPLTSYSTPLNVENVKPKYLYRKLKKNGDFQ